MVGVAEHAVDFVIRRHKGRRPCLYAGLHRREMNFPQLVRADPGRAGIDAAGGLALGAQVLGHHVDALAFHTPDRRPGHLGRQIGVLAEAFLTPAPAGVPEHIQRGYQRQVQTETAKLGAADLLRLLQKFRGEGAAGGQIHRQQIAVQRLMAVGAFCAQQRRNAEAGMVDDVFLNRVADLHRFHAGNAAFKVPTGPGVRPVQPVQGAHAAVAVHLVGKFPGKRQLSIPPLVGVKAVEPLIQLAHLFPQRHAGKQVLRPLFRRKCRIAVCFHSIPPVI